jgi:predicted anti-sigma-YlaC factor YlaD
MMNCDEIRASIHEALDDGPEAALPAEASAHLATCAACREAHRELAALASALRALPREPLPPETLDEVWRRTVRSRPSPASRPAVRLAAAAVLAVAVSATTLFLVLAPPAPHGPSASELARASAQADLVLSYTARALAVTREAAAERVLASKVSPAVRGAEAAHPSRRP